MRSVDVDDTVLLDGFAALGVRAGAATSEQVGLELAVSRAFEGLLPYSLSAADVREYVRAEARLPRRATAHGQSDDVARVLTKLDLVALGSELPPRPTARTVPVTYELDSWLDLRDWDARWAYFVAHSELQVPEVAAALRARGSRSDAAGRDAIAAEAAALVDRAGEVGPVQAVREHRDLRPVVFSNFDSRDAVMAKHLALASFVTSGALAWRPLLQMLTNRLAEAGDAAAESRVRFAELSAHGVGVADLEWVVELVQMSPQHAADALAEISDRWQQRLLLLTSGTHPVGYAGGVVASLNAAGFAPSRDLIDSLLIAASWMAGGDLHTRDIPAVVALLRKAIVDSQHLAVAGFTTDLLKALLGSIQSRTALETLADEASAHLHTLVAAGQPAGLIPLAEMVLTVREQIHEEGDPRWLSSRNDLATLCGLAGDDTRALRVHEETWRLYQQWRREDDLNALTTLHNLAVLYLMSERPEQALEWAGQCLDRLHWVSASHRQADLVSAAMHTTVQARIRLGQHDEALPMAR